MKTLLLTITAFFFLQFSFAQNTTSIDQSFCVSSADVASLLNRYHPELQSRQAELDSQYAVDIARRSGSLHRTSGTALYVLPVVVHIVHNNGAENISDAMVIQGIQDLNDAYANIGYYDSTTGVDTRIQFCLSKRDPNGNTTTGITRNVSAYTNMTLENDDLNVKNLNRWDPYCYVNIWLVKEICSSGSGCGVAGYAYFPSAYGTNIDGLVAEARWFGSSRANSGVHIHEIGHYLGLYHTFEGGCANNNCLTDGDHVCDTPPDASTAWVPCSSVPNSCSTDAQSGYTSDQPDLFQDYMDYSDLNCYSIFTQGQADRMKWTMDNVRTRILGCNSCLSPCTSAVTARFTSSTHAVQTGVSVTFTNTSGNATSYVWSSNGVNFSTAVSPSITFTSPGVYVIKLSADNADPNCVDEKVDTIIVSCSAHAAFTYPNSPTAVGPGIAITFSNQSTGATSYSWSVNGVQFSTVANPSHTFPANGTYWVKLTASNNYCSSQDSFRMFVCNPCVEICDNGIDDDGNNLFDCIDASCSCSKCSPKQANIWYFGFNAGVDFGTTPPTVTSNSPLHRDDASAIATDANGRLLFFTDGTTVWNRNNQVMTHGTGLLGTNSSGTCLIVPHPGNPALFYIFCTGTTDNMSSMGLWYTIVDMTLNYGMGDVDVNHKNINLLNVNQASEKIAAVRHCNNSSVWVATHEAANNVYDAYLIDSTGFHSAPIVSAVGTTFNTTSAGWDCPGVMKFSADGKRVATPLMNSHKIDVLDFNNSTGVFSRPLTINDGGQGLFLYGVEFSPNGKYLYATNSYNTSYLFQYDVTQTTSAAINASKYTIDSMLPPYMYSCLQNAPDNNLYVAIGSSTSIHSHYVASIPHPDARGVNCGINRQGLNLGSAYCSFGLPCFIQNYFVSGIAIDGPDSICGSTQDQVYHLTGQGSCEAITSWNIISGNASITAQSDTAAFVHFNSKGIVKLSVNVSNTCNAGSDTMTIFNIKGANLNLGPDTVECYAGVTVLNAGEGFRSYEWQNHSTDSTYTAYGAGKYYVTIHDYCGNIASDTVIVTVDSTTQIFLGNDTTICKGHSVTMSGPSVSNGVYTWSPNYAISATNTQVVTVSPIVTTIYTLAVKNKSGCTTMASRKVTISECTGMASVAAEMTFEIVPNPARDHVEIAVGDPGKVRALTVYNDLGQTVYFRDGMPTDPLDINLSGFAKGVYFVSVRYTDGSLATKRFVKE